MIVTIDGPAGAGKSTVARRLAAEIDFDYLDTGAMYRAMVFAAIQSGTDLESPAELLLACRQARLEFSLDRILLEGRPIEDQIRTPEVSQAVRFVADHPEIRNFLVEKQRQLAAGRDIVCEGRDQGTVAFPDAECKIFLTASSLERAHRRQQELAKRGIRSDVSQVQKEQDLRDSLDAQRPVGALRKAEDALEFNTDGKSLEQVVEELKTIIRNRLSS